MAVRSWRKMRKSPLYYVINIQLTRSCSALTSCCWLFPKKLRLGHTTMMGMKKKLLQLFFLLDKLEQPSSAHTHKPFKDVLPSFFLGKSEVNWIKTGIRWKTLLVWRLENFMKKIYQTPRNNSTIREQLALNFRIRIMFVVCSSPPARLSFSYNSIFHPYYVIFCLIFFFFIIVRLYKNFIVRTHTQSRTICREFTHFFHIRLRKVVGWVGRKRRKNFKMETTLRFSRLWNFIDENKLCFSVAKHLFELIKPESQSEGNVNILE